MEDRSAKYRKLSALEHVTTRPGMYVGSVEPASAQRWVCDVGEDLLAVRLATVECVPALLKLFDEVVSNALDASARDDTLKNVHVTLGERALTVRNDGAGITVEVRGPAGRASGAASKRAHPRAGARRHRPLRAPPYLWRASLG